MAGKTISMTDFKQAILLKKRGASNREIARQLGISRDTVNEKFSFINNKGYSLDVLLKMDEPELQRLFHAGHSAITERKKHLHFLQKLDYFKEQLEDKHMTRYILWEEYRKENPDGYGKSQFYHHLSQNLKVAKVTGVFSDLYEPGDLLMVDFAGDPLQIVDPVTGEVTDVQVFVSTMAFSDYTFAYAVPSQKTEHFLYALQICFEHMGGVPKRVRMDNLKAGVKKYHPHEPEFNKALQQMGNHYHFFCEACRPRKPKDKALVESAVRRVYNRVYVKLRGRIFHSLRELNEALAKAVLEHNQIRMQKKPFSRQECFIASEKDALQRLPDTPFELVYTANLTVQGDCHVYLATDKCHYSVPHIHVGKKATVSYTRSIVKIYVDDKVYTHLRNHDPYRFFVTEESHLASNNRAIRERSVQEYKNKAATISLALEKYIEAVFDDGLKAGFAVECRYGTCRGIISKARQYSKHIIEKGCEIAIDKGMFSSRAFGNLLETINKSDIAAREINRKNPTPTNGENLRGKDIWN